MALPSDILNQVDQVTLGFTAKAYQGIVSAHITELRMMLVIYFALFGIAVLQSTLSLTMREITKHVLKALIIFQLATNWGSFTTFVYNVFTSGPDQLTAALVGGSSPTQQLEDVFTTGVEAARDIYTKAGITDIAQMLLALLVLIGTILMVGVALFLIVLSKMGLAVLLSIAPIFIALALWKGTQGLFQGWINYLVNYAMIPVITYALMGLILAVMQDPLATIKQAGENLTLAAIVPYLLMGIISVLLFFQVPRIAASLGGGITLSAMEGLSRHFTRPISMATRWENNVQSAVGSLHNNRSVSSSGASKSASPTRPVAAKST